MWQLTFLLADSYPSKHRLLSNLECVVGRVLIRWRGRQSRLPIRGVPHGVHDDVQVAWYTRGRLCSLWHLYRRVGLGFLERLSLEFIDERANQGVSGGSARTSLGPTSVLQG